MSNTTLKSGLKFTISTDNGIFNTLGVSIGYQSKFNDL